MAIIKKILAVLLRILISAAIILFLFKNIDAKSLAQVIKSANKALILISSIVFLASYVLALLRWRMLLAAVGIRLPLKRVIASYSAGIFFNLFLPSSIGGDFMRSVDLSVHTKKPKEIIATVFLDRLSGYIGLVILASLSFVFGGELVREKGTVFALGIIIFILLFSLLVLFNKFIYRLISRFLRSSNPGNIRGLISDLHKEIHIFRHRKTIIIKNIVLSILIQAMAPLSFALLAFSLGLKVNLVYFFIFIPIIGAITLLPISIGGLGLRDLTTIYFFGKVGIAKDIAFAMSLLNFSFILVFGILGGLLYVFTVHYRRVQRSP